MADNCTQASRSALLAGNIRTLIPGVITLPSKTTKDNMQLEKSLKELEKLVDKMEQGDLSLEKSLDYFEKGIKLTRQCQQALQQAEQRVQILLKEAGQEHLEEFDDDT